MNQDDHPQRRNTCSVARVEYQLRMGDIVIDVSTRDRSKYRMVQQGCYAVLPWMVRSSVFAHVCVMQSYPISGSFARFDSDQSGQSIQMSRVSGCET